MRQRKEDSNGQNEELKYKLLYGANVQVSNFVAVAFSDPYAWYIATVLNQNDNGGFYVKFLHSSKENPCVFKWPKGSDNTVVEPKYIIQENVPLIADASLGSWKLDKQMYINIDKLFNAFARNHFK